jgi:hypothetical protein
MRKKRGVKAGLPETFELQSRQGKSAREALLRAGADAGRKVKFPYRGA